MVIVFYADESFRVHQNNSLPPLFLSELNRSSRGGNFPGIHFTAASLYWLRFSAIRQCIPCKASIAEVQGKHRGFCFCGLPLTAM